MRIYDIENDIKNLTSNLEELYFQLDDIFNKLENLELVINNFQSVSLNNVEVKIFNSLLVDFATNENCNVIIRGLRVLSDFEYEFKMALMNRNLNDKVTTLFMMPHEKYTHISSSLLKEVANLGGDINDYAPKLVIEQMNIKNVKK